MFNPKPALNKTYSKTYSFADVLESNFRSNRELKHKNTPKRNMTQTQPTNQNHVNKNSNNAKTII
jgi:hypothetical protein